MSMWDGTRCRQLPAFAPRTTAAGAIRLRTGFTDGQRSAFNVLAVEGGNRFDGFSVVTHVNEPKPFGLFRVTVGYNAQLFRRLQKANREPLP
jgi:hypothetical protein